MNLPLQHNKMLCYAVALILHFKGIFKVSLTHKKMFMDALMIGTVLST